MSRRLIAAAVAAALIGTASAGIGVAAEPASYDGLSRVKSKKLDSVYLLPGADFRGYTKVMLDPTEVAFQKNWLRDYNDSVTQLSARISQSDANEMLGKVRTGFEEIFHKAYTEAGYQVVTAPGPDVLRVRTGVGNLRVSAPDVMTTTRQRNFSEEAGQATLVLEARDSESGALLGRAVDTRLAGDTAPYMRNSVTNRADFKQLFEQWAKASVSGLAELKAQSPVSAQTARR